jgi:hypothetical protein
MESRVHGYLFFDDNKMISNYEVLLICVPILETALRPQKRENVWETWRRVSAA